MSRIIFDDPIQHGAADPTVLQHHETGVWYMFYTNRRADHPGEKYEWIHGSPIGIATSLDGQSWTYSGTVQGLDRAEDSGLNTHWAPEVIYAEGQYHMYLTYMAGTPDTYVDIHRALVHFTSPDLENWTRRSELDFGLPNMIDAAVFACPDGVWRMWFKSEAHGSATFSATSKDLYDWTLEEEVIPGSPKAPPHEGPNVFALGGYYWLITDEWRGQAVYRSDDTKSWQRQGVILEEAGKAEDDLRYARHADVVTQAPNLAEHEAALFYFTHPDWNEQAKKEPTSGSERRTAVHVAKLWVKDGVLHADRDVEPFALSEPEA